MAVPVSELQKANPSSIIELFILELSSTIHGASTVYRFHAGTNQNANGNIIFDGQTYTRMPIEADGFEYNGQQLPRPTLRVSNILGTFTTILLTLSMGLEGAKVTRRRTLLRYIDAANFPSSNSPYTPDTSALFPDEIYVIDRKSSETREIVEFELAAKIDVMGVRLPKRQVLPDEFPGIGSFYS
jgi:lambda family phage minor tail protein L